MNTRNNLKSNNKFFYAFSSYGVKIGLATSDLRTLNEIKKEVFEAMPFNPIEINYDEAVYNFEIHLTGVKYKLLRDDQELSLSSDKVHTYKYLQNEIRTTVAEFAVSRVFLHAGAVSIDNKGIIFPAESYHGKSTLTAELIKAGAVYYSDDFAVLDENARLHPFPKRISLRGIKDDFAQTDFPVKYFGGQVGTEPIEVKLIVLTEYEKDFKWSPELLSPGSAIMNILPHTVPIRSNPQFTLKVLHKLTNRAIIAKSKRNDAKNFVFTLLKFIEKLDL